MYETVNLPSGLISCDLLNTEFLLQFLSTGHRTKRIKRYIE